MKKFQEYYRGFKSNVFQPQTDQKIIVDAHKVFCHCRSAHNIRSFALLSKEQKYQRIPSLHPNHSLVSLCFVIRLAEGYAVHLQAEMHREKQLTHCKSR